MNDLPVCVLAFAGDKKPEDVVSAITSARSSFSENASLWLWIRGRYDNGSLSDGAWTAMINLHHADDWIVRNEIIWTCKVADPAPENRLKRGHENLYHLTKGMGYYYDRTMGSGIKGVLGRNSRGSIRTRSGVVGSRYSSQISKSPFLTEDEKTNAWKALATTCEAMQSGEVSDFRMFIRGVQSATRKVAEKVERDGFYIRTTKSHSEMVDDMWMNSFSETNAAIPEKIIQAILRLSCPLDGAVLDLFPTPAVAKAITNSGREYMAIGVGGAVECGPVDGPDVFGSEEVVHDTSDTQTIQAEEQPVNSQQGT